VDGHPKVDALPAAEYAVRMRQFPADARLDRRLEAGRVKPDDMRQLAMLLAAFHKQCPVQTGLQPQQAAERASAPALNNFDHIQGSHISIESRGKINAIEAWTREQAQALKPVFEQRAAEGFVRECHGDLHLANLFEWNGCIYPYDCLEFNAELRWIDPISDIAFLVMDLMARDRTDMAYLFLNAWLEESGDYQGLEVLRFYLVYRSMVRLKVASIQTRNLHEDAQGEHAIKARHYLELALMLMDKPAHPLLVLMHGMSASGKTRTSAGLMTTLPAVRIRSDLERKRLRGLPRYRHTQTGIDSDLYSAASTEQTYGVLAAFCETGLKAGFNMIADATFAKRYWRSHFIDLAARLGARPVICECSAPLAILKARIRQRVAEDSDESDADLAVLEHQLTHFEHLDDTERRFAMDDCFKLSADSRKRPV
ncbi:MAG TPA: AAA family ATPase, partial [Xanthomonadales bacterium]